MSSSQFDDLLGDFGGDSSTTATTKTAPNGDSGLLLDFTTNSEVSNGQNGVSSSSSNPLYEFDIGNDNSTSSANPLYDLDAQQPIEPTSSSSNPLYDFESDFNSNNNNPPPETSSSNPLYEFEDSAEAVPPTSDPFQDFENLGGGSTTNQDSSVDLLSGATSSDTPEITQDTQAESSDGDLLGDFTGGSHQHETEVPSSTVQEVDSGIQEISGISEQNGHNSLLGDFGDTATFESTVNVDDNQQIEVETTALTETSPTTGFEQPDVIQESVPDQWPPEESHQEPEIVTQPPEPVSPTPPPKEMPTIVNNYQSGYKEPQQQQQWDDEEDEEEEGVYENEPVKRDDLVRESDKKEEESLPSPGLAKNLLAKFSAGPSQDQTPRSKREVTPPNPTMGGGEYVSEPRVVLEKYEGKAESGVFESEPQRNPEIVRSDSHLEEAFPQQGSAKKFAERYQILDVERKNTVVTRQKQITPERDTGPVEYVSEPRGYVERYEGKAESGVFESEPEHIPDVVRAGDETAQEIVPEKGTAKNLAQRFHQFSVDSASPVTSNRNKRELTPDSSGRTEYVSEPRNHVETYEAKTESGVFENTPCEDPEVVKSETAAEEFVPERGFARNVAAKFKELESTAKSPPLSPGRRKEFTPPREDQGNRASGVYESTPEIKPDVVTSTDSQQEVLPGAGTARSLAQRYKEIEAQNKSPVASKPRKEFTPPPQETSVYENKPEKFQAEYNRPAESGILENQPMAQRDDVLRGNEPNTEVELPESGTAKNLVNKWRQIESESAKNSSPGSAGGRQKEFTPPREEPRIMQNSKSPRTPKSPTTDNSSQLDNGSVHPSELPGQYQPQNEPHVFESTPEPHPEARRESDTDWNQGLPKKNQAKKMLARFQSFQAEANKETPKPVSRKQASDASETSSGEPEDQGAMEETRLKFEDPDQVGRSKSMKAAIQVEKCGACDKTVYAMERLEMNKRVYHRSCFRCSQCKAVLTPKTFAINNEIIFCTTHYKQNFATKGNYDEGFGRQQHKKQWNSNPNLAAGVTTTSASDADKS